VLKQLDGGTLHVRDAEALTKLKDHPAKLDAALKYSRERDWPIERSVKMQLDALELEAKIAAAAEKLKADGVTVIDVPSCGWHSSKVKRLGREDWYGDVDVTPAKHKKEPCHVAAVDPRSAEIIYACTNPAAHKTKTPRRQKTPAELRQAAEDKALREAKAARVEVAGTALTTGKVNRNAVFDFIARVVIDDVRSDAATAACRILGIALKDDKGVNVYAPKAVRDYADKSPSCRDRAAVAVIMGTAEDKARYTTWASSPVMAAYFDFLREQMAYTPSPAELAKLNGKQLKIDEQLVAAP
jgi:hypothetical protein